MKNIFRTFALLGSINAFLCIAIGAFGAHALKDILGDKTAVYETGVQYHMMHALGLFAVAIVAKLLNVNSSKGLYWSGILMQIGIVLFSGSLYLLGITHINVLGAITPLGGVSFLVAWFLLAQAIWKSR